MWEVRAAEGRLEELVAFAALHAAPGAQVYRSADRVVVIDPSGPGLTHVPPELLAREPQVWSFERVARIDDPQHSADRD